MMKYCESLHIQITSQGLSITIECHGQTLVRNAEITNKDDINFIQPDLPSP